MRQVTLFSLAQVQDPIVREALKQIENASADNSNLTTNDFDIACRNLTVSGDIMPAFDGDMHIGADGNRIADVWAYDFHLWNDTSYSALLIGTFGNVLGREDSDGSNVLIASQGGHRFGHGNRDDYTTDVFIDVDGFVTIGTGETVLGGDVQPLLVSILHGSVSDPVTENRPTLAISRYEEKTADGQGAQSVAIYASVVANNTSVSGSNPQVNAANFRVRQNGDGDACAFFGDAYMYHADWRAFGGFCHANAAVFHSKATALEIGVTSNNGFDNSVGDGSYSTVGLNIEVDGANTGFAGISFANDAGGQWASGIYFDTPCIKTALVYAGPGSVVSGVDCSSATITGNFLSGPSSNFLVDGSGNLTAVSLTDTAAWTAFTCTMTPGAGTITTQSSTSKYKKIGRTVFVSIDVTISNVGTGSGSVTLSLPFATGGQMTIAGRESAVSGKTFTAIAGNGASTITAFNYDNSNPTMSNGVNYVATGVYMANA